MMGHLSPGTLLLAYTSLREQSDDGTPILKGLMREHLFSGDTRD